MAKSCEGHSRASVTLPRGAQSGGSSPQSCVNSQSSNSAISFSFLLCQPLFLGTYFFTIQTHHSSVTVCLGPGSLESLAQILWNVPSRSHVWIADHWWLVFPSMLLGCEANIYYSMMNRRTKSHKNEPEWKVSSFSSSYIYYYVGKYIIATEYVHWRQY